MMRTRKIALWLLTLLLSVVVVLASFLAVQYFRGRLSQAIYDGRQANLSLTAEAVVLRNEHALVSIKATTDTDALFALGFAHAQDRLWQMDMTRRAAQGRLSEYFGAVTIGYDRYIRSFDFPGLVDQAYAAMPEEDKARLEAYARGVNAYMQGDAYRASPEHIWLMVSPERWRETDSLLVAKMLWPTLSKNLFEEFSRAQLVAAAGPSFADAFFRPYPKDGHRAMDWIDLRRTLGEEALSSAFAQGRTSSPGVIKDTVEAENSNNWVVEGARSRSGHPLLANDPHLGLTMPGFWYLAALQFEGQTVAGATIPGLPAVVIGYNDAISWGTTNGGDTDVQDTYFEKLAEGDPASYTDGPIKRAFAVRDEVINIRFSDPVRQTYRKTVRGPVLEAQAIPVQLPTDQVVSLRWTALEGTDHTLRAIMAINRAKNVEDVLRAARSFKGPPQSIVYAERSGDIGLLALGDIPVRGPLHTTAGAATTDGSSPANAWVGTVPAQAIPHVRAPRSGQLVTANAMVVPDDYPYLRSTSAPDPSRQQRLADLLSMTNIHSVETFKAIQLDRSAPVHVRLLERLLALCSDCGETSDALAVLRAWQGDWAADTSAPALFAQWVSLLTQALYWDELGEVAVRYQRVNMRRLDDILSGQLAGWCDDVRSLSLRESCASIVSQTLKDAVSALSDEHGDWRSLRWGDLQRDAHSHLGLGQIPLLGPLLSRETKRAAAPDAPNVTVLRANALPEKSAVGFGPSLRFIIDMADPHAALFAQSSGQAGHFASPHYDDLQAIWARGDYVSFKDFEPTSRFVLTPR